MTTSPYDSLPSGNSDTVSKYVDVEIIPPPAPVIEPEPTNDQSSRHIAPKPRSIKAPQAAPAKTVPVTPPPQYTNISIKNLMECHEYILPFEETLLVPDTMPDMQKVLFAEGRADLSHQTKIRYDTNDFLEGRITVYTIYRPVRTPLSPAAGPAACTECPVDVVKSFLPFKTDKCWGNAAGDSFRPEVTIRSINAEMINERKFTVKGELLVKASRISGRELDLFKDTSDNDLVLRTADFNAVTLDYETSDITEISQEITIKESDPVPLKILQHSLDIVENHRQITSGKLVINASIHLAILYLGETSDGDQKLCSIASKIDFTQFIVMDDKTDPDLMQISFNGGSLDLTVESKEKFKLSGNVTVFVSSYCNKSIGTVSDAYHKIRTLHFNTLSNKISCVKDTVKGEISSREVIDLPDPDRRAASLLCGNCRVSSITGTVEKDRILLEGTVSAKLLALDEENVPFVINHTIPVRGTLSHTAEHCDPSMLSACIDAPVKEFWFSEINDRQIEINTVLKLSVWLFSEEQFFTIDTLCFDEDNDTGKKKHMAIYVVGDGDTLWDVAKKYRTDIDTLVLLNDLDPGKPLPVGAKLFISK